MSDGGWTMADDDATELRAMLSSWACAPLRKPPPALRAEAKTSAATSPPSRRAAARVDSPVTSIRPAGPGTPAGSSSAGR